MKTVVFGFTPEVEVGAIALTLGLGLSQILQLKSSKSFLEIYRQKLTFQVSIDRPTFEELLDAAIVAHGADWKFFAELRALARFVEWFRVY